MGVILVLSNTGKSRPEASTTRRGEERVRIFTIKAVPLVLTASPPSSSAMNNFARLLSLAALVASVSGM